MVLSFDQKFLFGVSRKHRIATATGPNEAFISNIGRRAASLTRLPFFLFEGSPNMPFNLRGHVLFAAETPPEPNPRRRFPRDERSLKGAQSQTGDQGVNRGGMRFSPPNPRPRQRVDRRGGNGSSSTGGGRDRRTSPRLRRATGDRNSRQPTPRKRSPRSRGRRHDRSSMGTDKGMNTGGGKADNRRLTRREIRSSTRTPPPP